MSTADEPDADPVDTGTETRHLCVCGMTVECMDEFVQHVSDDHDVFDIAVQSLHEEELEVPIDAE